MLRRCRKRCRQRLPSSDRGPSASNRTPDCDRYFSTETAKRYRPSAQRRYDSAAIIDLQLPQACRPRGTTSSDCLGTGHAKPMVPGFVERLFCLFGALFRRGLTTLFGPEILCQVGQNSRPISVLYLCTKSGHLVELCRPLLLGQMLFRNPAGIVALRTRRFHLRLHRAGRQWFTLRAEDTHGCEKKYWKKCSLQQFRSPGTHGSRSRSESPRRVLPLW